MFTHVRRREHRSWQPSWGGGTAADRTLRTTPQAQVERLEGRLLLARVHFVGTPVAVINEDNSVTVSGKIAGLGDNQSVTIAVEVPVTFTVVCQNPAGNIAPGQMHTGTLSGSGTFTSDKNGNVVFSVTTDAPTAEDDDCPNPKWTPVIQDVQFGDATITADGITTTVPVS
jgi:hypothetical protein